VCDDFRGAAVVGTALPEVPRVNSRPHGFPDSCKVRGEKRIQGIVLDTPRFPVAVLSCYRSLDLRTGCAGPAGCKLYCQ
jgi:hypothetical protein